MYHLPLFGIGILCFVDQDVIQAAVQFVEHPVGTASLRQQKTRLEHQIIVVQQGVVLFFTAIGRDQPLAEAQQQCGGGGDAGGVSPLANRLQTGAFPVQDFPGLWHDGNGLLGQGISVSRALAILGEKAR